ncbi:DNA polymerase thumb domain-containing protein [Aneurinibacillus migulanus]|uniref:DinB/UmuC family translesion DNA polymerase n=1 Tax=Aneurinibacillus migulanus TaxID=47500 RepID=UPI0030B8D25B
MDNRTDESWAYMEKSRIHGDKWNIARMIQREIWETFGIPTALGLGPNKLLAKLSLDLEAKKSKSGIAEITYEQVIEKVWPRNIEEVWGIGARMKIRLNNMGIYRMEQLAKTPIEVLRSQFGVMGEQLYWHAHGIDTSPPTHHFDQAGQKGFGHGITLLRDYGGGNGEDVKCVILELCEEVARRCRQAKRAARTVHLQIGYSRYEEKKGFSRSRTIGRATNVTMDIYAVAIGIFEENYQRHLVRTVYVSLTNLVSDEDIQLDLFEDVTKKHALGKVMDDIRAKYGSKALLRAASFTPAGTMVERSAKIGGHRA